MTSKRLLTAFILELALCAILAAPANDHATVDEQMAYLKQFGYLDENIGLSRSGAPNAQFEEAIREFQIYAGLEPSGVMDDATVAQMNTPRCGFVQGRFDAKTAWGHKDLTYRIDSYPDNGLTVAEVDSTIAEAFKFWSDKSTLTFTRKYSGLVDIVIIFAAGAHGDSGAFDGPSGVLAHAYFPHSGAQVVDGLWGDAHYDKSETWTIKSYSGINLLQVAVHEFGHSLGLGHSQVQDAIMYAFYRGYVPGMQLHSDDVAGIQYLYGASEATTQAPPTSTQAPPATTQAPPTTTQAPPTTTQAPPATTPSVPDSTTEPAPEECRNGFMKIEGVRRMGGQIIRSKNTLTACKNRCKNSANCWGFTFLEDAPSTRRCYNHRLKLYTFSKYNFYLKESSAGYTEMEGKAHREGMRFNDYLTQEDCEILCDMDIGCIGYTFPAIIQDDQKMHCRVHSYPELVTGDDSQNHYIKC